MTIRFTKMHGLGNDFVIIEAMDAPFSMTSEEIQRMGDRHLGVGFDQLLVIEPSARADFTYRIFNSDGSEVSQCGNGARCVALYIKHMGLSLQQEIRLATRESEILCHVQTDGIVSVQLPPPKFEHADIPFEPSRPTTNRKKFFLANVGNPHAVIVVSDFEGLDLVEVGEKFVDDKRFPEGVNVSLAQIISPKKMRLEVYERGVGPTQACGSAACAAMVTCYQQGLVDAAVLVSQKGGDLEIEWAGGEAPIVMKGPANFVFYGDYLLET